MATGLLSQILICSYFFQYYYLLQAMLLTGFPYHRSSFSSTATGYRILVTILDRLEKYLDAPETTEEGKVFELGYAFVSISTVPW